MPNPDTVPIPRGRIVEAASLSKADPSDAGVTDMVHASRLKFENPVRQTLGEFQHQELHEQIPDFNVPFAFEVGNAPTAIDIRYKLRTLPYRCPEPADLWCRFSAKSPKTEIDTRLLGLSVEA